MINPSLNIPQARFLALEHKFRAFVAGFGCLRGSTLVLTEYGPMPIMEIDRPMRVLSWSEKNNRFELSLSGGAFPKGAANLYRVVTQRGEFVASGHHHVLCADGSYRRVDNLDVSVKLSASSQNLLQTSLDEFPLSLHASDQHSIQKLADSMGRYADEARQYGQQLLLDQGIALDVAQQQGGVQVSYRYSERADVLEEPVQAHSHQDQRCDHQCSRGSVSRDERLSQRVLRCEHGECFEHTSQSSQVEQLSEQKLAGHQQAEEYPTSLTVSVLVSSSVLNLNRSAIHSDIHGCDHSQQVEPAEIPLPLSQQENKQDYPIQSFYSSLVESCDIIAVEILKEIEPYYDLQVLDNNCYVTADGLIHHNSGKTWVGCGSLCQHAWEWPKINSGYFAPTYPQIRDIFFPTIEEAAFDWGLTTKINESNKEVHLYNGRQYRSTIICRSMEKPGSIVGFKIGKGLVDELDVMTAAKAEMAWRKIIARMRYNVHGLKNGIDVTTTPEGFKFVHKQFVKQIRDKPELATLYGLIHASTYDNEKNLPHDYIDSLRASYPPQLIDAYLRGLFTNLTSGSVYPMFCRKKNHTDAHITPGETLHIGLDFNVLNMTAVVSVIRDGNPFTLAELTKVRDTPDMAKLIKEQFKDKGHPVIIYPDASGQNTSSKNYSESDLSILQQKGFNIVVDSQNPSVRGRVNAVNAMILNDRLERRWLVNTDNCPTTTEALEQQAYDKDGVPDKKSGHDHPNDAVGYFLAKRYPILRPSVAQTPLRM